MFYEQTLYKCAVEGVEPNSYFHLKVGDTAYTAYREYIDSKGISHEELYVIGHYSEKEKEMLDKAPNGSLLIMTVPPDAEPVIIPAIYPLSIKINTKESPVISSKALDYMKSHGWNYPVTED